MRDKCLKNKCLYHIMNSNTIQETIYELYESLYEITSEYIQVYPRLDVMNRTKYINHISEITENIKYYKLIKKNNIDYQSDLSFLNISRIRSLL